MKRLTRIMVLIVSLAIVFAACSSSNANRQETVKQLESGKAASLAETAGKPASELYPAYVMEGADKKWGYIDENGKFIIKAEYDNASDFQKNGLAVVMKNEKSGIIDKSGKPVVDPKYTHITEYAGKAAVASEDWSKYYLLDEKGQVLFETDGNIEKFSGGLAAFSRKIAQDKSLWGYVNDEGKVVVEPKYEYAREFINDKALVQISAEKHAIIDTKGSVIKEIQHDKIMGYSEDTLLFTKNDGNNGHKYGYMTIDGEVIIDAAFSYAYEFEDGLAIVNGADDFESKYGVINKKGEYVIPAKYPLITSLGGGLFAVPEIQEYTFNTTYLRKALFDKTGKQLTDFKYYDLERLENGFVAVTDDKNTILLDDKGNEAGAALKVQGVGSIKPSGKLYKAEADNTLYYFTQEGKEVWKSDSTIRLEDGLEIGVAAFRPDRCMFIEYPEIKGMSDKKLQEQINGKLKKEFVGDYTGSSKEGNAYTEVVDIGFGVERNKDLLIINKSGYFYPIGAAHGQPYREDLHINLSNGSFYTLRDLFKKDSKYKEKLAAIVKKKIDQMNKEEGFPIYSEDFGDMEESSGFTVKKDSLQIYFHPYAIAPYAAGFPEFDIPYEELKELINTEGEFWKAFDKDSSGQSQKAGSEIYPIERIQIEEAIKNYENLIVEAINKNDFKLVEPWLYPDSSLYISQKKLVEDLNKKNIKERLDNYTIEDIKANAMGSVYRVYVTETISIQYPGKDFAAKQFNWVYSTKYDYEKQRYLLTYIDKWEKK